MVPTADELDALFGALADSTRRELLLLLVRSGPASATRLAEGRTLTRQAIVKHLKALEDAGLVRSERSGREVRFIATTERLSTALTWMLDTGARWDRRSERLRSSASSAGRPAVAPKGASR